MVDVDAATLDAATDAAGRQALTRREQKETYENNKLFKRRIVCQIGQMIGDFSMIEQGDKVDKYARRTARTATRDARRAAAPA